MRWRSLLPPKQLGWPLALHSGQLPLGGTITVHPRILVIRLFLVPRHCSSAIFSIIHPHYPHHPLPQARILIRTLTMSHPAFSHHSRSTAGRHLLRNVPCLKKLILFVTALVLLMIPVHRSQTWNVARVIDGPGPLVDILSMHHIGNIHFAPHTHSFS